MEGKKLSPQEKDRYEEQQEEPIQVLKDVFLGVKSLILRGISNG